MNIQSDEELASRRSQRATSVLTKRKIAEAARIESLSSSAVFKHWDNVALESSVSKPIQSTQRPLRTTVPGGRSIVKEEPLSLPGLEAEADDSSGDECVDGRNNPRRQEERSRSGFLSPSMAASEEDSAAIRVSHKQDGGPGDSHEALASLNGGAFLATTTTYVAAAGAGNVSGSTARRSSNAKQGRQRGQNVSPSRKKSPVAASSKDGHYSGPRRDDASAALIDCSSDEEPIKRRRSAKRLKKIQPSEQDQPFPRWHVTEDFEQDCSIVTILARSMMNGEPHYRVRWHPSWVPERDLNPELVRDFNECREKLDAERKTCPCCNDDFGPAPPTKFDRKDRKIVRNLKPCCWRGSEEQYAQDIISRYEALTHALQHSRNSSMQSAIPSKSGVFSAVSGAQSHGEALGRSYLDISLASNVSATSSAGDLLPQSSFRANPAPAAFSWTRPKQPLSSKAKIDNAFQSTSSEPSKTLLDYGEDKLQRFINFCLRYVADLEVPVKRANFIEFRKGMLNVSPIGRNCSQAEREAFAAFDEVHKIREKLIEALKLNFPESDFGFQYSIGDQISIDVFPAGWDKSECLKHSVHDGFTNNHFSADNVLPLGSSSARRIVSAGGNAAVQKPSQAPIAQAAGVPAPRRATFVTSMPLPCKAMTVTCEFCKRPYTVGANSSSVPAATAQKVDDSLDSCCRICQRPFEEPQSTNAVFPEMIEKRSEPPPTAFAQPNPQPLPLENDLAFRTSLRGPGIARYNKVVDGFALEQIKAAMESAREDSGAELEDIDLSISPQPSTSGAEPAAKRGRPRTTTSFTCTGCNYTFKHQSSFCKHVNMLRCRGPSSKD